MKDLDVMNFDFVFGEFYRVKLEGSCDTCGSPYFLENSILKYQGFYEDRGHMFQVMTPFGCEGCHRTVDTQFLADSMDVTEELKHKEINGHL
jgi:hypothetical protein